MNNYTIINLSNNKVELRIIELNYNYYYESSLSNNVVATLSSQSEVKSRRL